MPWREPEFSGEFPSLGWEIIRTWHDLFPSPRDEREPFTLTEDQVGVIVRWYRIDPTTGEFVFHRGCSRRSKGSGKSPLEAAKAITELALPCVFDGFTAAGEPVARPWGSGDLPIPWCQIASLSEEQDQNTYQPLVAFLSANGGRLGDALNLDVGVGRVLHRAMPGARIEPVTSRAGSREGQPVTYGVLDETGLMTRQNGGVRLAAAIRRNTAKMGGRSYETTNGYMPGEGSVAEATENAAMQQTTIFYDAVEAPTTIGGVTVNEEAPDTVLRAALQVCYPGAWWVDLDRIVRNIRDRDTPWPESERWFMNWNRKSEAAAVDPERWAELADHDRIVGEDERIGLGFDGSISNDATALIGCTEDGYIFEVHVWEKPLDAEGHPVKGWRVPRGEVHDVLRDTMRTYDVGRFYVDPPKWFSELDEWVAEYNTDDEPVVVAFDTFIPKRMGPAIDRWRTAIREGQLSHDGSDTLTRHVSAAQLTKARVKADEDDGRILWALTKPDDGRKIDAAVASVLAFEAAATMPEPQPSLEPFFHFS